MPRNFNRRIEIAFPVMEPQIQTRLKEILELQLADSVKAWWMKADGSYVRRRNKDMSTWRFQERYYEILQAENKSSASKGTPVD